MRIILIRHGDPDYANDSLTEKGVREAKLLADRIASWENITEFYCSPLGRAKKTASYSLEKIGRSAVIYEWLKEFSYYVDNPDTGEHDVPWDFMPHYWTEINEMYDKENWKRTEIYRSNPDLVPAYEEVCRKFDELLSSYGYTRCHNYYQTTHKETPDKHDHTIVIFCHLGISFVMLSHLLGISPAILFHGFFVAPTSVTILAAEERIPGKAYFRAQVVGDTLHLQQGNEPISEAGYFSDVFLR